MPKFQYILGLDLGANSLGWSIVRLKGDKPVAVERVGVRCFEAGVDGNIEMGKDSSRAAARRMKRLPRRQFWRRARRLKKLMVVLQRNGLLPSGDIRSPIARHELLLQLDRELRSQFLQAGDHVDAQLLPYRLRAYAVEQHIPRFALGRALYHLAQRRGYNSGLKGIVIAEEDDDLGVVKRDIQELESKLDGRTLGQYLASTDPHSRTIRRRWTSRGMYRYEFERIWEKQSQYDASLTNELKVEIYRTIFYQRPLKSVKGLVGHCTLEVKKRRAALALPLAQECRVLQGVNHLTVRLPGEQSVPLSLEQRTLVIDALMTGGDLTFAALRKLLKLSKAKFNLEEGGEKRLLGDRTNSQLSAIFGLERWADFSFDERTQIVREVLAYQKRDALIRRSQRAWGLNRDQAEALAEVRLEPGYARHSVAALQRLLPYLREGLAYSEAVKRAYPDHHDVSQVYEELPPVVKAKPDLRNPAVVRALTELRKVVNCLIVKYGKPKYIHIELARDLKRSRKDRQLLADRMRKQQARRAEALARVLEKFPNYQPRRGFDPAIEKILLAEECNWTCPYTGKSITLDTLLGSNPQFDVEHIFPRRYLDNSFVNKTLCYHEENRQRKRDCLPAQAYAGDRHRFEEILSRVRAFRGPAARAKLERFLVTEVASDFVDRQLNDTRYNTVAAAEYLGLLYGGRVDENRILRVRTLSGAHTAILRGQWRLNEILGNGELKSRADHRHHAIDAAVIALIHPGTVQAIQRAGEEAGRLGLDRDFAQIAAPWTDLDRQVRKAINEMIVSHRSSRKLSGPFHAETIYSPPKTQVSGEAKSHVRKELHKLTAVEIRGEAIVDSVVRQAVQKKFNELGGGNPSILFADSANHPFLVAKDGRQIPIHKVRLRTGDKTWQIGLKNQPRYVTSTGGTNHHIAIMATLDSHGRETAWKYVVVTRHDMAKRLAHATRAKERLASQPFEPQPSAAYRRVFDLAINECVQMCDEQGRTGIYRVVNISANEIQFQLHSDGRDSNTLRKEKARIRKSSEALRRAAARKVYVSPIGDIRFVDNAT